MAFQLGRVKQEEVAQDARLEWLQGQPFFQLPSAIPYIIDTRLLPIDSDAPYYPFYPLLSADDMKVILACLELAIK